MIFMFVFPAQEDDEGKTSDGISFSSSTGPAWAGSERDYTYDEVGKLKMDPQLRFRHKQTTHSAGGKTAFLCSGKCNWREEGRGVSSSSLFLSMSWN